jgi:hypothetical protein
MAGSGGELPNWPPAARRTLAPIAKVRIREGVKVCNWRDADAGGLRARPPLLEAAAGVSGLAKP